VMGAPDLAARLKDTAGYEARVTVLGHIQRGGSPTAADAILASKMGAYAVEALLAGKSGVMVCCQNGHMVTRPLPVAWEEEKIMSEEVLTPNRNAFNIIGIIGAKKGKCIMCGEDLIKNISFIVASDSGRKRSSFLSQERYWKKALELLLLCKRPMIVTGFYAKRKMFSRNGWPHGCRHFR